MKTLVKLRLVQILVVVAIIQMKTLKTEVEKGSMWTMLEVSDCSPANRERELGLDRRETG